MVYSICIELTQYCEKCGGICLSSGALMKNDIKYCRKCYEDLK